MAHIPVHEKNKFIIPSLADKLIHQGKVRDTYKVIFGGMEKILLVVATDRLSIFDFVLPVTVPRKGEVLTALNHFWLTQVLTHFTGHLISSWSKGKDHNLAWDLRHHPHMDIPLERSLAVQQLNILPYEMILRGHIGGSVWKEYEEFQTAGGQLMPPNLQKWARLTRPAFTPSTKAEIGHDVNINAEAFFASAGDTGKRAVAMLLDAYRKAYEFAEAKGILVLDTKFEVGMDSNGKLMIADEVITPDSSRFTTKTDFAHAMRKEKDPAFYDKEPVRQWGKMVKTPFHDKHGKEIAGINNLDPTNEKHLAFVDGIDVPPAVIAATSERYGKIFEMITSLSLDNYQKKYLL